MTGPGILDLRDGVALIGIAATGPDDALATLARAVEAADRDADVRGMVLSAGAHGFALGIDLAAHGGPERMAGLAALCSRIEACGKPVLAAIEGRCLGPELELALAAHLRILGPGARLGLPGLRLGLPPGAGATQRLPRLVGAEQALRLLRSGRAIRAAEAQRIGLAEAVVEGAPVEAARALARDLAAEGRPPQPTRDRTEGLRDPAAFAAAIAAARKTRPDPHLPAAARIGARLVDCVEAALLLPYDSGLAFEATAFEDCAASPASQGLRHAARAAVRLARPPEAAVPARPLAEIGILGGGTRGAGLTVLCLAAGFSVTLLERDRDGLIAALERIALIHDTAVENGRMTPEARDAEWLRLTGTADPAVLATADLVIEALPEDPATVAARATDLGAILKPGAVLATTGGAPDLAALGRAFGRPADLVALHLMPDGAAPALAELAPGPATADAALTTARALAGRLGLACLPATTSTFPMARILAAARAAADELLLEGATPAGIDAALRDHGLARGPCETADAAGLDLSLLQSAEGAGLPPAPPLAELLVADGRLGRRSGAGYYRWTEAGRSEGDDPDTLALIAAEQQARGLPPPREIPAAEIVTRCLDAMTAEGARLVEAGAVRRPSDLDIAAIEGAGYPRWRGGPMMQADLGGLLALRKRLEARAGTAPGLWTPAQLLSELIKNGRSFETLNTD